MDKAVVLILAMKELGANLGDRFIDLKYERIIFQKCGYLLSDKFNFPVGHFNLYLNGVYNPSFANEGFSISNNIDELQRTIADKSLKPRAKERLEKIKSLFESINRIEWSQKLELFTTLLWFNREKHLSFNNALEMTKETKPQLYDKYGESFLNDVFTKYNSI